MAYPSRDTLVEASSVAALTSLEPTEQDKLRQMAIYAAENFTGQKFDLEELVMQIDGSGRRELALPRRLATLDDLLVQGSSLTASDVSLSAYHDTLYVNNEGSFNWVEQAMHENTPPVFAYGVRSVTISGDWGWTDEELDPEDATSRLAIGLRMDMEEQALALTAGVSETSRAYVKLRVSTLNEGPLSMNMTGVPIGLSPDVMMVLEPYVWRPLGVVR